MKLLKRITAVIYALLIVVNISVIKIFAVGAAPVVAGEELAEILIAALLSSGHSQSELSNMSLTQLQSSFTDDVNNGKITVDMPITDPVTGLGMSFLEFMNKPENKVARAIILNAADEFVDSVLNPSDNSLGGVDHGGVSSSGRRDEYFTPTSTADLMGCGAKAVITYANGNQRVFTCEYIIVDTSRGVDSTTITLRSTDGECYQYDLQKDGTYKLTWQSGGSANLGISGSGTTISDFGISDRSGNIYNLYGDVRTIEGERFETDDEFEYQVGEVDGTKVTLDMINPDGTVTIDGVTYYPADYLDPDKLSEEGKKQLINNITNVINNTYVKSEDKPLVDEDDITVEVAEELEDFTVPTGIITVFPFCLPFDFVRGMKLFSAKPVTPHFEITIDVPAILNVPAQKWTLEIDLGRFETLAKITRWLSLFGFSRLLIFLSTKIVKGAGA